MTGKEIIQALRVCTRAELFKGGDCYNCPAVGSKHCISEVMLGSSDLLEQLTAENADLRKEIEWKDMVIALAQRKQAEAEAERDALREKVPRWISVDDRRPKPGTRVLATDGVFVGEAIYALDGRWSGYGGGILRDCLGSVITHWMPLPETPEEDDT